MPIKKKSDLTYADVTPKGLYMGRRNFLLGLLATTGAVEAYKKYPWLVSAAGPLGSMPVKIGNLNHGPYSKDNIDEKVTPPQDVTHYNNYYEFGTDKADPAKNSKNFVTTPWAVSVEGEVKTPRKFTIDEIMKLAPLEERIYRHRCVEAWSIVVPWIGYSLSVILKTVEPTPAAKFVAFESYFDKKQMPLWRYAGIDLPYVEGLRMDEAMHPLALLCVGMYGETLAQSGRRSGPRGDPLEIWVQERQIHRKDPFRHQSASHHLEYRERARIRLLFQRESKGRPSALEPGPRTPSRRRLFRSPHRDAHVQRLRRSGRQHVYRHGPEEILLGSESR